MAERGMVEPQALQEALNSCTKGGVAFPMALVNANLVADWELSRVVCKLYNLPFLTVDMCTPDPSAFEGISEDYIRETGLIPLSRYGQVLTVCMPGLVPAETLGLLSAELDVFILPVVGTVRSNWMWIESHMETEQPKTMTPPPSGPADWSDIFDAADAAVLLDLEDELSDGSFEGPSIDTDDLEDQTEELDLDLDTPSSSSMPRLGPAREGGSSDLGSDV